MINKSLDDKEKEILIKRIENIEKNPSSTIPWRQVRQDAKKNTK